MSADPLYNHVLSSAAQHPCRRPRTAAKEMGGTYVPCIVDFPMKRDGHPLLNKNIPHIYIHILTIHIYIWLYVICYILYIVYQILCNIYIYIYIILHYILHLIYYILYIMYYILHITFAKFIQILRIPSMGLMTPIENMSSLPLTLSWAVDLPVEDPCWLLCLPWNALDTPVMTTGMEIDVGTCGDQHRTSICHNMSTWKPWNRKHMDDFWRLRICAIYIYII